MKDDKDGTDSQRIDRWLWFARLFKSRSLAARTVIDTSVRVTRGGTTLRIEKPAFTLRIHDVVTLKHGREVRNLEVVALGWRRGPASEAQGLYRDLTPAALTADPTPIEAPRPAARPRKKDRRAIARLKRLIGRGDG